MQHKQQETLVHIISLLNVTRYATQVNRQHTNLGMDTVEKTHQDITMLYNITRSLYTSLNYQQIVLHIHSILADLRDSLYYMRQVAMHAMDYKDTVTTGILSANVLPVEDLWIMLIHIEEALPSTMYLPVSSDDTLHFYRYLHTHILISDKLFLLLINVPIQDCAQQLENIWSLQFSHTLWKLLSMLQQRQQVFAALTHLFNHLPIQHHVLQLYTQRTKQELIKDGHYRSGTPIVPPSPHQ